MDKDWFYIFSWLIGCTLIGFGTNWLVGVGVAILYMNIHLA